MRTTPLILIADDNANNRDILQTRLGTQGYEVMAAADGEEALALALRHQPDLLLLDIMMPKLDGARSLPQAQGQRFVALHAHHHGHRAG